MAYHKHGLSQTPEYKCWQQIKARCLNPNHRAFPHYGGRGIIICPEWESDFLAFLEHVGPRPSPKHSLDRKDVEGDYEPGNVRWATDVEQNNNQRPQSKWGEGPGLRPVRQGHRTNFKHGMINTPEYQAWSAMKDRCLNPKSSNYPRWGGRGIKVHPEWAGDFMAFYLDVGPRPTPKHSLDRIDNDGNYEPGNVRWATKKEQADNRRPCPSGPEHGNYSHGRTQTPEYKTWGAIKTRCYNPKHDGYARYGALGVKVCARWRESFDAFLADLGPKPDPKFKLVRRDLEGHYSCGKCEECRREGWPANCVWATPTHVNRRRRGSKLTEERVEAIRRRLAEGATQPTVAKEFGVGVSLVGKIKRRENWA